MPKTFRQILWSREILLVIGFYAVFAVFYYLAIDFSSGGENTYYRWQVLLDYPLKGLLTLPIWWLFFRRLRHIPIWQQAGLHIIILPLFVKGWQQLYYLACESLDLGHLGGSGQWWDIYIPAMFYVLQFGIFHTYDYYSRLQEAREKEMQLQQTALTSELTALKAQLNPHFLYNTFNTISASVPKEQEKTREMIASLADLFRYQLWASQQEVVPFKVEVQFIQKYLELEQARFGERLQIDIIAPYETEDVPVPPMLLQPLIENAVRHGISPKVEGGTVALHAQLVDNELRVQISDTGVGFDETKRQKSNGIGLYNTRRRLKIRYDQELTIEPNQPSGTRISFTIPKTTYVPKSSDHRRRRTSPQPA